MVRCCYTRIPSVSGSLQKPWFAQYASSHAIPGAFAELPGDLLFTGRLTKNRQTDIESQARASVLSFGQPDWTSFSGFTLNTYNL